MNDYVDMLICVALILAFWLLSRLRVWRTCRCGAQYCTSCARRK